MLSWWRRRVRRCAHCLARPPRRGSVICQACADRQQGRRRARLARGECPKCQAPLAPGKTLCPDHLAAAARDAAAHRRRQGAARAGG